MVRGPSPVPTYSTVAPSSACSPSSFSASEGLVVPYLSSVVGMRRATSRRPGREITKRYEQRNWRGGEEGRPGTRWNFSHERSRASRDVAGGGGSHRTLADRYGGEVWASDTRIAYPRVGGSIPSLAIVVSPPLDYPPLTNLCPFRLERRAGCGFCPTKGAGPHNRSAKSSARRGAWRRRRGPFLRVPRAAR